MTTRPYNSSRRKEQATQTRERLLQAAMTFLEEHEAHELSLPKIAKLAGVASGTVYVYFPDEDALVLAAIERHREQTGTVAIDRDLSADQLPEVPLLTYPRYDRDRRWTTLTAHSLAMSRLRKADRGPAVALMSERLRELAPQLSPEELAAVAGAIHLFTVPRAWYWLEEHADLSDDMAARAASWAMKTLIDSLRVDPEAIRRTPAPHVLPSEEGAAE